MYDVLDDAGQRVGAVVRTSPTCDGVTGYQGPTDTLIVLDAQDRVVRGSRYDPVTTINRMCATFGRRVLLHAVQSAWTLAELADWIWRPPEVEGVSGRR